MNGGYNTDITVTVDKVDLGVIDIHGAGGTVLTRQFITSYTLGVDAMSCRKGYLHRFFGDIRLEKADASDLTATAFEDALRTNNLRKLEMRVASSLGYNVRIRRTSSPGPRTVYVSMDKRVYDALTSTKRRNSIFEITAFVLRGLQELAEEAKAGLW